MQVKSHLWLKVFIQQDILEFEVPVSNTIIVAMLHPVNYLCKHFSCTSLIHPFFLLHKVKKLTTRDVFHCNPKMFGCLECYNDGIESFVKPWNRIPYFNNKQLSILQHIIYKPKTYSQKRWQCSGDLEGVSCWPFLYWFSLCSWYYYSCLRSCRPISGRPKVRRKKKRLWNTKSATP